MCNFYLVRVMKFPARCISFSGLLLVSSLCHGGADVCSDPGDDSFASVDFSNHDTSTIDGLAADTNQLNQNLDVLVSASKRFLFGFAHRYMIFDFSGIEPQTNAHLHTSFAPLHWRFPDGDRNVRLSVAPALSASSNVMGHPRKYDGDTLQFLVAWVAENRLSDRVSMSYGICGDHRFGEYEIYPVAGIQWRPHSDWEFGLGFPSSYLRYEVTEQFTSALQIAPDGNEWHVMDRDFQKESRLVYESVALEWVTSWQFGPQLALEISVGRQLRNRYELTLQNGDRVQLSSGPTNRLGAGLRWRF